ncbi:MAG: hypothetical protein QXL15_02170, partial [Candidatus Korarchaeota archaeon]
CGVNPSSVLVTIDGEFRSFIFNLPWINFTESYSLYLSNGTHNVTVRATDTLGNELQWTREFQVHNMPPYVESYYPENGSWTNKRNVTFVLVFPSYGAGVDPYSFVVFLNDTNVTENASVNFDNITGRVRVTIYELNEGSYSVRIYFNDTAPNPYTGSITLVINVDLTPPKAPTGVELRYNEVDNSIMLSWRASESDDVVRYVVYRRTQGGEWVMLGTTTSLVYVDRQIAPGETYEYKIEAVDRAGNTAVTESVIFEVPKVELILGLDITQLLMLLLVVVGSIGVGLAVAVKRRTPKKEAIVEIPEEETKPVELPPIESEISKAILPEEVEMLGSAYLYDGTGSEEGRNAIGTIAELLKGKGIPSVIAESGELDFVITNSKLALLLNPSNGEAMVLYAPQYAEVASHLAEKLMQKGYGAFANSIEEGLGQFEFTIGVFVTNIVPGVENKVVELLSEL